MLNGGAFTFIVDESDFGKRLDVVVVAHLSHYSRSFVSYLIRTGSIRVDGAIKKSGYRVRVGEKIRGHIPLPEPPTFEPQPIEIDILFEDEDIVLINKKAGIVVHPAPGHYTGTLVNALLHHCPDLIGTGGEIRPGIVHRLDKDTSGVLVVAKNTVAHFKLASLFKSRTVQKDYLALVYGDMAPETGAITLPIGRHPSDRKKMSTISKKSRTSETIWRVRERYDGITLLELSLKTGRTHQLRVHCTAIKHPIVGDSVYTRRNAGKYLSPKDIAILIKSVSRQMLHAWHLKFAHPATGEIVSFEAPVPEDMDTLISRLRGKEEE